MMTRMCKNFSNFQDFFWIYAKLTITCSKSTEEALENSKTNTYLKAFVLTRHKCEYSLCVFFDRCISIGEYFSNLQIPRICFINVSHMRKFSLG